MSSSNTLLPALKNKIPTLIGALLFILLACIGLAYFKDYGVAADELAHRGIAQTSLLYLSHLFGWETFLNGASLLSNPADIFKLQKDANYGVTFDLPVELLIQWLKISGPDIFYLRHLLTFFSFILAVLCFYDLAKNRYASWQMGTLGALLLILSPRIFGSAFFNHKDLFFMSMFLIASWALIRFLQRPSIWSVLLLAATSAFAIDTRIMGILIPCLAAPIFIAWSHLEKRRLQYTLAQLFGLILCTIIFIIAFWPWLWTNPLENFIAGFTGMARFHLKINMLFMGDVISSTNLPWYYIPVWLGVTTPISYLAFFFLGLGAIIYQGIWRVKSSWNEFGQWQDTLFVILLFAPCIAVIVLHSVLYNTWRQMYFIYPAFLWIALRGIDLILSLVKNRVIAKRILILLISLNLAWIGLWMVRHHPNEHLYFNALAGNWSKKYEVDTWAMAYTEPLRKIVAQDPKKHYSVFDESTVGWIFNPIWKNTYLVNMNILPSQDYSRIDSSRSQDCSDYIITAIEGEDKLYAQKSEFQKFHEVIVDGKAVYTTYQRKIPLFELYPTKLNTQITFSDPNSRCFLKTGWHNTHESWGVWSVNRQTKLWLPLPPNTKQIVLDVQALAIAGKHQQVVDIGINGTRVKTVTLSRFDNNQIIIDAPSRTRNQEFVEIDFSLPNAISPKSLGTADDDRLLGLGLKKVEFK